MVSYAFNQNVPRNHGEIDPRTRQNIERHARAVLETLDVLSQIDNKIIFGEKGAGKFGKFEINYNAGISREDGPIPYTGIDIKYDGETVYKHHGDTIEYKPGNWEDTLAALPIAAAGSRMLTDFRKKSEQAVTRHLPRGPL